MRWYNAVYLAKQYEMSFEEWCDLYVSKNEPTDEQIEKATRTAHTVLVRNNVIDDYVRLS